MIPFEAVLVPKKLEMIAYAIFLNQIKTVLVVFLILNLPDNQKLSLMFFNYYAGRFAEQREMRRDLVHGSIFFA